ncbi:MAG: GNAT family N-acetyltransferase [Imperialibacter sp.]|uniref:GNAT family N-acetyltransferase n=1 Tax=Imperialibacter sp. TaxID=2038411 RepID=UPI003A86228B
MGKDARRKLTGDGQKSSLNSKMRQEKILQVHASDEGLIQQIANWYLAEWDIPIARTTQRLATHPGNNDMLFQFLILADGKPVTTGGLSNHVGLLEAHPSLQIYKPWVSLLYTTVDYRNQGLGRQLLERIEAESLKLGYEQLYLHTFTAESLYKRLGWKGIDVADYKNHKTVVMTKQLNPT